MGTGKKFKEAFKSLEKDIKKAFKPKDKKADTSEYKAEDNKFDPQAYYLVKGEELADLIKQATSEIVNQKIISGEICGGEKLHELQEKISKHFSTSYTEYHEIHTESVGETAENIQT